MRWTSLGCAAAVALALFVEAGAASASGHLGDAPTIRERPTVFDRLTRGRGRVRVDVLDANGRRVEGIVAHHRAVTSDGRHVIAAYIGRRRNPTAAAPDPELEAALRREVARVENLNIPLKIGGAGAVALATGLGMGMGSGWFAIPFALALSVIPSGFVEGAWWSRTNRAADNLARQSQPRPHF